MAYLNQQEREKLLNDLKDMNFNKAKAKVRGLDRESRLAYYRNVQNTANRLYTRYDLPGLGTRVTLVEAGNLSSLNDKNFPERMRNKNSLVEVIVEPTADNRT
jgi:hypothetical protein